MDVKQTILKVLDKYEVEAKGKTFIIYTTEGRVDTLMDVSKKIKGAKYSKTGSSSAGEVQVPPYKIIAKPPKKGGAGAGSGAGAYITAVAESAQCYYCAAAWYGKDYSEKTLKATARYVRASISVDEVIKNLPDHWVVSCRVSADILKKNYGSKKYTFHRGSPLVDSISNNFNRVNKIQKLFSNINKWSPADIYMVSDVGQKASFNFDDLNGLNTYMMKMIKSKDLVGVSLKQTKTAHLEKVNVDKNRPEYKYISATTGKRGYFDSKDVYINYDGGEIQFRGFPLTWQGEIKGKTANHGKLSVGPIKTIVDRYSGVSDKMDTQMNTQTAIGMKNKTFYKKWYGYYTSVVGKNMKEDEFTKKVMPMPLEWQVSKFLGTQLIFILNKSKNKQLIVSSMINYAKSVSEFSAPYLKVS